MEFLLNMVWLVITVGTLVRLGVWAAEQHDGARVRRVALATVAALALLFPIISATDDLQSSVATVEESVSVRRIVASAALHLVPVLAVALAFVYSLTISLTALGFTTLRAFELPASPSRFVLALRGPPSIV